MPSRPEEKLVFLGYSKGATDVLEAHGPATRSSPLARPAVVSTGRCGQRYADCRRRRRSFIKGTDGSECLPAAAVRQAMGGPSKA
ncbi:MAG: hypothetical protein MZU95_10995 [Desulfomicrobium escambiense]|nr:hypothetical protein [Desulfomicrobium escambiense]